MMIVNTIAVALAQHVRPGQQLQRSAGPRLVEGERGHRLAQTTSELAQARATERRGRRRNTNEWRRIVRLWPFAS